MTPDPPSPSPDGPMLPPRHRPTLKDITQDSTELDLWAFEEELNQSEAAAKPDQTAKSQVRSGEIPPARERQVTIQRESREATEKTISSSGNGGIQMNVTKSRPTTDGSAVPLDVVQLKDDLDDLEDWDDVSMATQIEELPDAPLPKESEKTKIPETGPAMLDVQQEPEPEPARTPAIEAAQSAPEAETKPAAISQENEFTPAKRSDAKPLSLRPRLGLNLIERIGLVVLLALLLVGGLAVLVFSIMRLPSESARAGAADFPIKGSRMTIESADSYWREPITDGTSPDIVRRGTKLVPVIEFRVSEGNGAIRVLFRNDERVVIGDAVTRTVHGSGLQVIAATAGFDDLGMHAAYRTGGSKPWTIEVYEAAAETAAGKDFKKLFELNISTDRR